LDALLDEKLVRAYLVQRHLPHTHTHTHTHTNTYE
jgi:hypothetical protein